MEHLGFITKRNIKYALIHNGNYLVPLPGGKKIRVTLGALRKAGWKIEPYAHASEEGLRLLNG
jgi:hypothetical protein